jgi:hypothetical protein
MEPEGLVGDIGHPMLDSLGRAFNGLKKPPCSKNWNREACQSNVGFAKRL